MAESCDSLLDRVAKSRERLNADLQLLKSSDPAECRLSKAYGYWGSYPLQKECLIDSNKLDADDAVLSNLYDLQYKLDAVHKEATVVLMQRAEQWGLDSAPIWQSAAYCRDLLASEPQKHYPADRGDDLGPGCLGRSLYELPEDIRKAIVGGHAQVMRLGITPQNEGDAFVSAATTETVQPGDTRRVLLTATDETVLAVANNPDMSINQKLRRIAAIKSEAVLWDSPQWADLLDRSAPLIRQQASWKEWRAAEKKDD